MNRRTMRTLLGTALLATAPLALAQSDMPTHHGDEPMMHAQDADAMHQDMHGDAMLGEHDMPGTVTRVDHKTGIVELTSLGMKLRVHFPPPTIARLKAGDHILLHLGYRMRK